MILSVGYRVKSNRGVQFRQFQKKKNIHDRFLLIDNDIYHIGASLKDLGRKLFAFSKMTTPAPELLKNIP
jgi:hypothetical protein